ncbi:MAG TPA: hypothetical protein DCY07_05095 [Rhodospirillaceae bacterium]|nr:hypothetical protein [Rhodospirillaceae bacterium]
MAGTEQLPATQYKVGGQPTLAGWQVISATHGLEEDSENKQTASGRFKCKITYSRRPTLQVVLEANSGTTTTTYQTGGEIASGVFAAGNGSATAWKIRSARKVNTRGPEQVELDLIAQTDLLAVV